jgi:hypothetical protein
LSERLLLRLASFAVALFVSALMVFQTWRLSRPFCRERARWRDSALASVHSMI